MSTPTKARKAPDRARIARPATFSNYAHPTGSPSKDPHDTIPLGVLSQHIHHDGAMPQVDGMHPRATLKSAGLRRSTSLPRGASSKEPKRWIPGGPSGQTTHNQQAQVPPRFSPAPPPPDAHHRNEDFQHHQGLTDAEISQKMLLQGPSTPRSTTSAKSKTRPSPRAPTTRQYGMSRAARRSASQPATPSRPPFAGGGTTYSHRHTAKAEQSLPLSAMALALERGEKKLSRPELAAFELELEAALVDEQVKVDTMVNTLEGLKQRGPQAKSSLARAEESLDRATKLLIKVVADQPRVGLPLPIPFLLPVKKEARRGLLTAKQVTVPSDPSAGVDRCISRVDTLLFASDEALTAAWVPPTLEPSPMPADWTVAASSSTNDHANDKTSTSAPDNEGQISLRPPTDHDQGASKHGLELEPEAAGAPPIEPASACGPADSDGTASDFSSESSSDSDAVGGLGLGVGAIRAKRNSIYRFSDLMPDRSPL